MDKSILKPLLAALNGEEFDDDVITEEGVLLHFGRIAGDADVPDGVTAIANGAFRDCPELMELCIPHSVKHIADHAFDGTTVSTQTAFFFFDPGT